MRVCEVMTKQPTCCTPFCTAQMAAEMMKHTDTGFLSVLENFTGSLIQAKDICSALETKL